jgi:hypothetical protein
MKATLLYSALGLLSVIVLAGCGGGGDNDQVFNQVDRLARPAVNEVFAAASNGQHKANNEIGPAQDGDSGRIRDNIVSFAKNTAGRSDAIASTLGAVLAPDVLKADLNEAGPAAYLGVETGGATGGKFGGRKLSDDVVDISLGAIFGGTIPALGLTPDDGKAIPTLTSDNVDASGKHFQATFPYLGDPS